jgi:hypothetical protein
MMTIQPFLSACVPGVVPGTVTALITALLLAPLIASADPPARHDYPTVARVEYVNDCIRQNGGTLAALYQCSCAIDEFAARLSYDEFVEAGTYARYAALPGEGGGIFRDSDDAKARARLYRELEGEARRSCGLAR